MEKPRKLSNNLRGLGHSPKAPVTPAIVFAAVFACSFCFGGETAGNLDGEYEEISRNTVNLTEQLETPALAHVLPTLYTVKTSQKAGVRYDSNINTSEDAKSDLIYTFEPSIYIGFGDVSRDIPQTGWDAPNTPLRSKARLLLGYTAMAGAFQRNDDQNYLDHNAWAFGGMRLGKTTLEATARYQRLSSPDYDLGQRVKRTIISGSFKGRYNLSARSSLETVLSADSKDYEVGSDSETAELHSFYDYNLSPKTQLGAGFGLGHVNSSSDDGDSDQTYEQALVRARWQPDKKLTVQIQTGVEFRHVNPLNEDQVNPLLLAEATYRPRHNTRITLSASQQTTTSADATSESAERTRAGLTLEQIFFQRLTVAASVNWQRSDYQSTFVAESSDRTEDYVSTVLNVSYKFAQNWAVEANFQYNQNSSNSGDQDYEQNIAEIRVVFGL